MKKVCFIASTGGHFEQIIVLKPLMDIYDSFVVTERTTYSVSEGKEKIYYLKQVNRREKSCIFKMMINSIKTLKIFIRERPDVVISTGALVCIPMCIISKIFKKKMIFIESFANIKCQTLTGKFLYRFADQFYVQWEDMIKLYPKAIYKGGIY